MLTRLHYLILLSFLTVTVYIYKSTPSHEVRKFHIYSMNPFSNNTSEDSKSNEYNPRINQNSLLKTDYPKFLRENPNTFIIEPYLLNRKIERESKSAQEFEEFKWRFNLPQEFRWSRNCLTLGIYAEKFYNSTIINGKFNEILRVTGRNGPFEFSNNSNTSHHIFYLSKIEAKFSLQLHLVVFYRIKNFLWIGSIPESYEFTLTGNHDHNPNHSFILHYGKVEQIFDPFKIVSSNENRFLYPRDAKHFVGQLPTSRYIHCPEERVKWLKANNATIDENKIKASIKAIVNFKRFMNAMQMEFWIACGTLLGWHRQCQVTPYTTDTDFATWSKYLQGMDPTKTWKAEAVKHGLGLYIRFGEPTHTMELSFWLLPRLEKVDLFFIYQNVSHYLLPYHAPPKYAYSYYPKYELCSVELLGYKLLAPCDPESVIKIEYGNNWSKPITDWNYISAPLNVGKLIDFSFNVTQLEKF